MGSGQIWWLKCLINLFISWDIYLHLCGMHNIYIHISRVFTIRITHMCMIVEKKKVQLSRPEANAVLFYS